MCACSRTKWACGYVVCVSQAVCLCVWGFLCIYLICVCLRASEQAFVCSGSYADAHTCFRTRLGYFHVSAHECILSTSMGRTDLTETWTTLTNKKLMASKSFNSNFKRSTVRFLNCLYVCHPTRIWTNTQRSECTHEDEEVSEKTRGSE